MTIAPSLRRSLLAARLSAAALVVIAGCGSSNPAPEAGGAGADAGGTSSGGGNTPGDAGNGDGAASGGADGSVAPDGSVAADGGPAPRNWVEAFDHVFPEDRVVQVSLTFAPGDWAKLLDDWQVLQQKNEYPARFAFDDELLASVGARLKGLNGLSLPPGPVNLGGKYPLKVDFNATGGERFHGVDGLSLNTNLQDPSMMRERLSLLMYREMGVPSSRATYASVTVEGANVGLYNSAQLIDKQYLKERFGTANGNDDGNLYKCVYNSQGVCSLEFRGTSKSDYYFTDCTQGFDECGIVLKTNEDDPALNDYQDFIHFLDVLHNTPAAALQNEIEKVFDVDGFLKVAAVAFAISNSDSYFGKGHNYYLYRRPDTGRFQYLPWDLDLTYGSTSCEADIGDPTCGQADTHPLVGKLFSIPAYRAKYLQYLRQVAEEHLTVEKHDAWVDKLDALIGPLVAADPNIPGKAEYEAARDQIRVFVMERRADILQRLDADSGG